MKHFTKGFLLIALCAVLAAAGCAAAVKVPEATAPAVETAAPAGEMAEAGETPPEAEDKVGFGIFETMDIEGNEVNQSIFADANLTMVNIWATFCGPCINEMPELGELAAEYADKQVQIIGIVGDVGYSGTVTEAEFATVKEIVIKTKAAYTHLLPSDSITSTVLNNIYAFPTTVFVDRDGNLVGDPVVGSQSKAAWAKLMDGYLPGLTAAYSIEDMRYNPGSCCG